MNHVERQMVRILDELAREYGVVSVKAEFEAEGTRDDEMLRLLDVASTAGLGLTLKVGGCEAIRDLYSSKQFGARYVVAPMIESPYALQKYVGAIRTVYSPDEIHSVDFLFNVETFHGLSAFPEMLTSIRKSHPEIGGVVFGRVDYVGSLGLERDEVVSDHVTDSIREVATGCKSIGLDLVVGGGVSSDSLRALAMIAEVHLSRFETRKVVFPGASISGPTISQGLLLAVKFELLWLENKQSYYARIAAEDQKRIDMLRNRWNDLL